MSEFVDRFCLPRLEPDGIGGFKPAIHFTNASGLATFTRGAGGRELPPGQYLVIAEFTRELRDRFPALDDLTDPGDAGPEGQRYIGLNASAVASDSFTGALKEVFLITSKKRLEND